MKQRFLRNALASVALSVVAAGSAFSCGGDTGPKDGGDSSTHWLSRCDGDGDCGTLSCVCGVCTEPCAAATSCPKVATVECGALAVPGCADDRAVCVAQCEGGADCAAIGSGLRCISGQCLPTPTPTPTPDGGASGSGGSGSGDASGSGGRPLDRCIPGEQIACACANGTLGTQTCEAGGMTLTPCSCSGFRWYQSCGFPVCGGPLGDAGTGAPVCTTEQLGSPCEAGSASCDNGDGCGVVLVCADSDPTTGPGGCPISRARFKEGIRYVTETERAAYARKLTSLPLATYRYRDAPGDREHLGFIIEDIEPTTDVATSGDHVDLYGYASLAVAAIQEQERRIDDLEAEVKALRAELEKGH